MQSKYREDYSSSLFSQSHRLPVQGFLEVLLSLLLVLLLSEQAILPNHILLHTNLEKLSCQALLLQSLTCQALHQLLISSCLLKRGGRLK